MRKHVEIYTDGACSGNPGPGGYGVILMYGSLKRELSGGEKQTTNNRMELSGVIRGLSALREPCTVDLYTDSQYVVNAVNQGWAKKWRANGWMRNKREAALNPDLWEQLLALCETHDVTFHWVKGHAEIACFPAGYASRRGVIRQAISQHPPRRHNRVHYEAIHWVWYEPAVMPQAISLPLRRGRRHSFGKPTGG